MSAFSMNALFLNIRLIDRFPFELLLKWIWTGQSIRKEWQKIFVPIYIVLQYNGNDYPFDTHEW